MQESLFTHVRLKLEGRGVYENRRNAILSENIIPAHEYKKSGKADITPTACQIPECSHHTQKEANIHTHTHTFVNDLTLTFMWNKSFFFSN